MQTTNQFFNCKQLSDPTSVAMTNFHIGGPTIMIEIFCYNWFTPPRILSALTCHINMYAWMPVFRGLIVPSEYLTKMTLTFVLDTLLISFFLAQV